MILLRAEQTELANWITELSQDAFDEFLGRTINCRVHHFSSKVLPMPVVAVDFIGWLEKNPLQITVLLTGVLEEFAQHPSAPVLQAALQRHWHAQTRGAITRFPWDAVLVRGVPIVNRAQLRAELASLVGGGWRSLILVAGQERSGRTHSWHLIDHVAEFLFLMEKLHLPAALPTTIGTTVTTIAERYAHAVATAITAAQIRRPVWMVFDSVDRPTTPEVKEFVCALAEQCLSGDLRDCKVFLLGADRDLGIDDPHRRAQVESLSIFLPQEITDTATALNALGRKPLSEDDLANRVREMLDLSALHPEPLMWEAVAEKLVDLRIEVEA
jgi:hypothetical protein